MEKINDKTRYDHQFTLKPSPSVAARVRDFLNERLQQYGGDCTELYVNTVHSIVEPQLTFSQDLLDLGINTLEWGTVQSYNSWESGVFSKGWTFEAQYRLAQFTVEHVEQLMKELLEEAKFQWFA